MTEDEARAIIDNSQVYFEIRKAKPIEAIVDGSWITLREMEAMIVLMRAADKAKASEL